MYSAHAAKKRTDQRQKAQEIIEAGERRASTQSADSDNSHTSVVSRGSLDSLYGLFQPEVYFTRWDTFRSQHQLLTMSVALEKYVMICSWFFFATSSLQLAVLLFEELATIGVYVGLIANVIYSATYFSFVYLAAWMVIRPSGVHILGIVLLTLGYFVSLTQGISLLNGQAWPPPRWRLVPVLFLVGCLMFAEAVRPRRTRGFAFDPPLTSAAASLFWGSLAFVVGSACFFDFEDVMQTKIGMVFFVLGRALFIRGSQTSRCDALFRNYALLQIQRHLSRSAAARRVQREAGEVSTFGVSEEGEEESSSVSIGVQREAGDLGTLGVVEEGEEASISVTSGLEREAGEVGTYGVAEEGEEQEDGSTWLSDQCPTQLADEESMDIDSFDLVI